MKKTLIFALMSLWAMSLWAKVRPAAIISDNMVLQREAQVALWGEATPGSKVRISASWSKSRIETTADGAGRWSARMLTPEAGGPYSITFDDGEKTTIGNVLVGEVWLCSGQSNMEMPISGWDSQPVDGSVEVITHANAEIPIRHCYVKRSKSFTEERDCEATWTECTPTDVSGWSAVAYFFARKLQEVLRVPVGVVNASWGGTAIEGWMNKDLLERDFAGEFDFSSYTTRVWPNENNGTAPASLYNAMLHPIVPFTVKGFVWYQGETNRTRFEQYKRLQPAFVDMLRREWGCDTLPFYFTQIAPYKYDNPDSPQSGYMMWAQAQTIDMIPRSDMATTLDCGTRDGIHPSDKATVGRRLAYLALAHDYGFSMIDVSAPVAQSFSFGNGEAVVTFRTGQQGVMPLDAEIEGFEVAGADRVFYPATGVVHYDDKMRVHVRSQQVPQPVAVRYAIKNWAEATLFNCYGIPVSPFRSDDW